MLSTLPQHIQEGFDQSLQGALPKDDGNIVTFELSPIENEAKSKLAGYPVYEDVELITIRAPGMRDFIQRVVTEQDKANHAAKYQAFKAGLDDPTQGTPLKEWPPISRAQAMTLAGLGIKTVEHIAAVSDANIGALGHGGYALRKKAQEWLQRAKSLAPTAKLEAENAELRSKLEVLARAVETLQQQKGIEPQPLVEMPAPAAKSKKKRAPKAPTET